MEILFIFLIVVCATLMAESYTAKSITARILIRSISKLNFDRVECGNDRFSLRREQQSICVNLFLKIHKYSKIKQSAN